MLYYLPNEDAQRPNLVTLERMRELGLDYALDHVTPSGVRGGPDQGNGVIVADGRHVHKIGYYRDRQTWRKIPGLDAWVGFYHNQRPAPGDLARAGQIGGHWIKLGDDQQWLCPVARGWSDDELNPGWYHNVPRMTELTAGGAWVPGDVKPRYQRLWQIATSYWDAKSGAINQAIEAESPNPQTPKFPEFADPPVHAIFDFGDFGGLNDAACEVLAFNYRLGPAEVSLLGLFDSETPIEILDALIDWPTYCAWAQKKINAELGGRIADGSNTADGPPAETPATAPA